MATYAVDWVDAFTDQPFGGNGCAVIHDGGMLSAADCMRVVQETSLVECTFIGPSEVADVRVRYFLASREIPFAGHPTIATVASLIERGLVRTTSITLETEAGIVPVEITQTGPTPQIRMLQNAPQFGASPDPALVAAVGGIDPAKIIAPPQIVSTGLPFCITVLQDHDTLRALKLDHSALAQLATSLDYDGTDMMEPFWVTLRGATDAGQTFSRLLLAPPSPPEDPFTGSATGAMAAYLWHHGLIDTPSFRAEQGHWLGRPGAAKVTVQGPPGAINGVYVEGTAYILMSGDIRLG